MPLDIQVKQVILSIVFGRNALSYSESSSWGTRGKLYFDRRFEVEIPSRKERVVLSVLSHNLVERWCATSTDLDLMASQERGYLFQVQIYVAAWISLESHTTIFRRQRFCSLKRLATWCKKKGCTLIVVTVR